MHGKKNRGFTLAETILTAGLTGIMIMLIQPLVSSVSRSRNFLTTIHSRQLKASRLPELIRDAFESAGFGDAEYAGKEHLRSGRGVYEVTSSTIKTLDEAFFAGRKEKGNFLFLELPTAWNDTVASRFVAFRVLDGNLSLLHYSITGGVLKQTREDVILTNVEGTASMDDKLFSLSLHYQKGSDQFAMETLVPVGGSNEN